MGLSYTRIGQPNLPQFLEVHAERLCDVIKLVHEGDLGRKETVLHVFTQFSKSSGRVVVLHMWSDTIFIQGLSQIEDRARPANNQKSTLAFSRPGMRRSFAEI